LINVTVVVGGLLFYESNFSFPLCGLIVFVQFVPLYLVYSNFPYFYVMRNSAGRFYKEAQEVRESSLENVPGKFFIESRNIDLGTVKKEYIHTVPPTMEFGALR
jgi:hypothetical protein